MKLSKIFISENVLTNRSSCTYSIEIVVDKIKWSRPFKNFILFQVFLPTMIALFRFPVVNFWNRDKSAGKLHGSLLLIPIPLFLSIATIPLISIYIYKIIFRFYI